MADPLHSALGLSIGKEGSGRRSGSIAYSKSGHMYAAGSIESDSHLLEVSSEQGALVQAVHAGDFDIERVETLGESEEISPLPLKVLADFESRTSQSVAYSYRSVSGTSSFSVPSAKKALPFYASTLSPFRYAKKPPADSPVATSTGDYLSDLRRAALQGLSTSFPTRPGGSAYAAAVMDQSGAIRFGGQYSSPDKRLGLHAEMAVLASALMSGMRALTRLAIVSTKFPDAPCDICGCCRQFIYEISSKLGVSIEIVAFASETDAFKKYSIEELLPAAWSSKKW